MKTVLPIALFVAAAAAAQSPAELASQRGEEARQAFLACWRYVHGWLQHADPESGLIPRNLNRDPYWNAKDAAADNYPFMVLTTFFTDKAMYEGRMRDMLAAEQRLANRVGALPDDYVFATNAFRTDEPDMPSLIFGASEYAKDGLLPITEWLGATPWSDRMIALIDAVWDHADTETEVGPLPATSHEVSGEMMQVLSRLYWMTGNDTYKEEAFRLADYFFVHHPVEEQNELRLDDHGCEVIGGLSEVYFLAARKAPERHAGWKPAMHRMLDRVLEVGRNENGLLYNRVNPVTGDVLDDELTDNWGYNYNAFLVVAELDNAPRFREAVEHVLRELPASKDYPWEGARSDGFADSLEGCLNLMKRIPTPEAAEWADYTARRMFALQRDTGVIEGWHGDGNFARTAIMYALWKTQGTWVEPWRADLRVGAFRDDDGALHVVVEADWPWEGVLRFDRPRHAAYLGMPADYARLNQFPEWFTAVAGRRYETSDGVVDGSRLQEGVPIDVAADKPFRLVIQSSRD